MVARLLASMPGINDKASETLSSVGNGFAVGGLFAAAGGLAMGGQAAIRTALESRRRGEGLKPNWSQTVEAAVVSARCGFTAGGFARFLFPNLVRHGVGLPAENTKPLSRAASALIELGSRSALNTPVGRAAVLGAVVAITGALVVGAQRITDTAVTNWSEGEGLKVGWSKVAKSALSAAAMSLAAGAVGGLAFARPLSRLIGPGPG